MNATKILNRIALKYEAENPDKFYAVDLKKFKVVCDGRTYQSCRKKAARLIPDCDFTIQKKMPSILAL